jgi:hypothetical protein
MKTINIIKNKYFTPDTVHLYCENFLLELPQHDVSVTKSYSSDKLKNFYEESFYKERFISFDFVKKYFDINLFTQNPFSQGVINPPTWKGLEMIKSTSDIALYMMLLQDVDFKSLVELGTGNGNALKFFQDISKNDLEIRSFDKNGVDNYCDLRDLNNLKSYESKFQNLPSPTLFIEDSHINVFNTLEYLFQFSTPGCYFFIEDSIPPNTFKDVEKFCRKYSSQLYIDRKYTGRFGEFNSIVLKHLKP